MKIETVTADTFEQVLPLISDYQHFYKATPDEGRNRAHFSRFITDHINGIQFVALDDEGQALGFATLYFPMHSVTPGVACLMNDLFTVAEVRGKGIGRALITHCLHYAQEHGYSALEWQTAPSNERAQRLYDSMSGTRGTWYTYTLPVGTLSSE